MIVYIIFIIFCFLLLPVQTLSVPRADTMGGGPSPPDGLSREGGNDPLRFLGKKCSQFVKTIFLLYLIVCTHFSRYLKEL